MFQTQTEKIVTKRMCRSFRRHRGPHSTAVTCTRRYSGPRRWLLWSQCYKAIHMKVNLNMDLRYSIAVRYDLM